MSEMDARNKAIEDSELNEVAGGARLYDEYGRLVYDDGDSYNYNSYNRQSSRHSSGGGSTILGSQGGTNTLRHTWQCGTCFNKFYSEADWKSHSEATGHAQHSERYE
jgi:hypothetical protein